MAQTIIPAGYRIHVTSWENDADNYQTKTLEGVVKEHIPFILAACDLLDDSCNNSSKFGNIYEGSLDGLREALDDLLKEYPDRPAGCDSGEAIVEGLLSSLGLTYTGEFTTRVFDNVKIEYVPQEILLEDVTSQFI
jgi:hypothetical protein